VTSLPFVANPFCANYTRLGTILMTTLIANIGQLVTPVSDDEVRRRRGTPLKVLKGTELLIHNGRIASIGTGIAPDRVETRLDADGGVVLPGLIDPHTHLPASQGRGGGSADISSAGDGGWETSIQEHLQRMVRSGTTTVEIKCAVRSQSFDELITLQQFSGRRAPRVISTLFNSVPLEEALSSSTGRISAIIGELIPTVRRRRLAQFCDVDCGAKTYTHTEARTILRAARGAGLRLKLHSNGEDVRNIVDLAAELEVTSVDLVGPVSRRDGQHLGQAGVVPVFLPWNALGSGRSDQSLRVLLESGLPVGLGSDQGSSPIGIGSMWLVLALAISLLGMSLEQAITVCTLHNATALGMSGDVGSLDEGKAADLLILDIGDYRQLLQGLGREPIRSVVVGGDVVYQR